MSNVAGAKTSREEEIAFLVIEQVLGVAVQLTDAGGGDKMPDGRWVYADGQTLQGIVEVTSPPTTSLMAERARAKRLGQPWAESGSIPLRMNELAQMCTEMLADDWAGENVTKLVAQPADERHLFLFARSYEVGDAFFYRLSDSYDDGMVEQVEDIALPEGITDVWFCGRARSVEPIETMDISVARFQSGSGWHRYVATIAERCLPSPAPGIADDRLPIGWRRPKDRSV